MAIVRLEGMGQLKGECSDLIGNLTRGIPACSIVPQPLLMEAALRSVS
jgi:hypothetical protein